MKTSFFQPHCSPKLAALLFALLLSLSVQAQNVVTVPFNGVVTDVLGQPLKKVKVYNYDARRYTFSDKKGKFGLTNVNATDTLHFIYQKRQYDVPVNGMKSMRVRLADQLQDVAEDAELVNLGMGYVKRREFNGSSSGLSGEELIRMGYTDITTALLGCVPGVTMYGGTLVIRGVSSITLSNEPLYLVDQVEVSSLQGVSIYEVDRIEVIKDANMYGAKGANGVIAITTKRGR